MTTEDGIIPYEILISLLLPIFKNMILYSCILKLKTIFLIKGVYYDKDTEKI